MSTRVNVVTHPSQLTLQKFDSNILLELFPFAIILDHEMQVKKCGEKLLETWILQNPLKDTQTFYNAVVTKHFKLRRPKGIVFNWHTVCQMNTVLFELELIREPERIYDHPILGATAISDMTTEELLEEQLKAIHLTDIEGITAASFVPDGTSVPARGTLGNYRLLLKGQMRYIVDIDAIVFLCSPL